MNARDRATFCHCPVDSSLPSLNQLPSWVLKPLSMRSINGVAMPFWAESAQRSVVAETLDIAGADVFADRKLVAVEVLKNDANGAMQGFGVPFRAHHVRAA